MDLVKKVDEKFGDSNLKVVFPETEDPRVLHAAEYLVRQHVCSVLLVGERVKIKELADREGVNLSEAIDIVNQKAPEYKENLISNYIQKNKHKGTTKEEAESALKSCLFFGASLVSTGVADGCVAGSIATTGDVIRAAIKCIGLSDRSSIVSSIFLMNMPGGKVFTYGDCGVVPYPDSKQLADIAIDSARTHAIITGEEPVVAMLSFSTKGSAKHEGVDLVIDALNIAKKKEPSLKIDGELQFDAAFLPEVARRKAPGSKVAGKANVFIFPNLDAGNISYKITERLAGAEATGPILQGLEKPMMDLSRGCNWKDIVNAACVALLMKKE